MDALLIGGTGAMGVYLTPILLRDGYNVYVTTRNKKNEEKNNKRLHYVSVNAHEDSFFEILKGKKWDVIVDFMVYSTSEFELRYKKLLEATKHYIFLSSYRVFSDKDEVISEKTPKLIDVVADKNYLKTDEYALAKARQEKILQESTESNWTIIRPSITYSKNRLQFITYEANMILFRTMNSYPLVASEASLEKFTTMTWAGDVARMISCIASDERTFREDYNVVTSESVKWGNILNIYNKKLGLRVNIVSEKDFESIVENKYQLIYDRLFDRKMNNQKIRNLMGEDSWKLKSIYDGLDQEIDYVKATKNITFGRNYKMDGKIDYFTNVKSLSRNAGLKNIVRYRLGFYGEALRSIFFR